MSEQERDDLYCDSVKVKYFSLLRCFVLRITYWTAIFPVKPLSYVTRLGILGQR